MNLNLEDYEKGCLMNLGVVVVDIGIFIGCLLKDKYIVYDEIIKDYIWWIIDEVKNDNKLMS